MNYTKAALLAAALFSSSSIFAAAGRGSPLPELFSAARSAPAHAKGVALQSYRIPVIVNTDALYKLPLKSEARLSLPGIGEYVVVFDEAPRYPAGVREWRGHVKGVADKRVVLVTSKEGSSGYVQTPAGNFKLGYMDGVQWLVADSAPRKPVLSLSSPTEILNVKAAKGSSATTPSASTARTAPARAAYEVEFNIAELSSLEENTETSLSLPNAGTYRVLYEQTVANEGGSATWVGYLRDYGNDYRVVITYGPGGSEGQILTPYGEFLLQNLNGKQWLIDVTKSGLTNPIPHHTDGIAPQLSTSDDKASALKAGTAAAEASGTASLSIAPLTASSTAVASPSTIDLLVLYTPGLATRLGAGLQTRLDQLVALANQAYKDSGVATTLRLVGKQVVSYTDTNSNSTVLSVLKAGSDPAFVNVASLRQQYGADLVSLVRPFYKSSQGGCGVAYIGGYGGNPISQYAGYGFSVVSDGTDVGGSNYYCNNYSFTHELGHNMGSMHDRATVAAQGGGTGAYLYSFGYGQAGAFGTIMSYISPRIGKFSNPYDATCAGTYVCGVSESNPTSSANNALSLNNTSAGVAAFMAATTSSSISITGTIAWNGSPLSGVNLLSTTGASCTKTGTNGVYSCTIPKGWSGTVSPSLLGYAFTPTSRTYSGLQTSQVNRNYTATKK